MTTTVQSPTQAVTLSPLRQLGRRPLSGTQLLVSLVLLLLVLPWVARVRYGELVEALLLTLVLLSAVLAVGARGRTLLVAILLVAPPLLGKWIDYWRPAYFPQWFLLSSAALFVAYVVCNLLRFIVVAPRVNTEVLCAGVSGYLLMGLLWAFIYASIAQVDPRSFAITVATAGDPPLRGFQAIYFSFMTLNTVGYGDIVPVSQSARSLAILESTAGLFYMTVLVARLVSLYAGTPRELEGGSGRPDAPATDSHLLDP